MKRPLMVIATASLLAASSASAADLPARLYTKAPVVTKVHVKGRLRAGQRRDRD